MTSYEMDARVPLIVRVPGYRRGQCQGMVEFVDIYPTLCELAGITGGPELEGRSFVALLENPRRKGTASGFSSVLARGDPGCTGRC